MRSNETVGQKPLSPLANRVVGDAELLCSLVDSESVCRAQNDSCPQGRALLAGGGSLELLQLALVLTRENHGLRHGAGHRLWIGKLT